MATGRIPINGTAAIQETIVDAKGDLIVGTGADAVARLAVGTNGHTLVADSSVSPTGLKWAVDPVADVITTAGDLIYGTAADTVARLGIGTAGQVLKVNSGATAPEWGAATTSSQSFTLISTTNLSGATTTVSGLSGNNQFYFFINGASMSGAGQDLIIRFNSDSGSNYKAVGIQVNGTTLDGFDNFDSTQVAFAQQGDAAANTITGYLMLDGANATTIKPYTWCSYANGTNNKNRMGMGRYLGTSVISSVSVIAGSGTFDAGSILVYGA